MSDKISLEHLIRNIADGKFTPSDEPRVTLEHAIKKVVRKESSYAAKDSRSVDEDDIKLPGNQDKMDESVGSMGTDKFQGNQFKSVRTSTPHIRPPGKSAEGSEPQAPENVSRQRSLAKEKSSMTMQGNVTEATWKTKVATAIFDTPKMAPTANLPAVVKSEIPAVRKATDVATTTSSVPAVRTPSTPPAVKPEVKAEVKPVAKTEVKPETKVSTEVKPETKTKTDTKVVSPVKTDTKVDTKTPSVAKVATALAAAAAIPAATSLKSTKPQVAAGTPTAPGERVAAKIGDKPKAFSFKGPKLNVPHDANYDILDYVPVQVRNHFAKKETRYASMKEENERKNIENVPRKDAGDRKELEYVGRTNTKQKTLARNASVKNVVTEAKKLAAVVKKVAKERKEDGGFDGKTKVYNDPPVTINPPEKRLDLGVNEGLIGKVLKSNVKTAGAVSGIGGLVGGAAAGYQGASPKEIGQTAVDTAKSVFTEPYRKYKEGDYKGAAMDVLTTLNPGAAAAEIGGIAASTELGKKAGKKIGELPGAQKAADYMRKAGETIGVREPKPEVKPLGAGEGIKLQPKPKPKQ